jgi:hypothetical protein
MTSRESRIWRTANITRAAIPSAPAAIPGDTYSTVTEHLSGLTPGLHTVQTQIFTANGTTIYNYDIIYRAYNR